MPRPDPAAPAGASGSRRAGAALVAVVGVATLLGGCAVDGSTSPTGATPAGTAQPTRPADPADAVTNGIDQVPADRALREATDVLLAAQSYRVSGAPTAGAPLDLVFVSGTTVAVPDDAATPRPTDEAGTTATDQPEPAIVSGRGSQGTVSRDGSTFELVAVDGAVYVRGNLDWLAEAIDEDARRTLGEKWLLLPASVAETLAVFTDPQAFATAVLTPSGEVQTVGVSRIDDEPALGIRDVGTESTTWVSGLDSPYPVLVERLGATATDGVLRFSDIDAEVTLTPPAADMVVAVPEAS